MRRMQRRSGDRFESTEHLSLEAVAAYVDKELSPVAAHRAELHLAQCLVCQQEVLQQRQASDRVRCSHHEELKAPESLVARLALIETSCPSDAQRDDVRCESDKQSLKQRINVFYQAVRHVQKVSDSPGQPTARP